MSFVLASGKTTVLESDPSGTCSTMLGGHVIVGGVVSTIYRYPSYREPERGGGRNEVIEGECYEQTECTKHLLYI